MRIYDISVTISPELPVWPGDPRPELERISKIEDGEEANITYLKMGAHTGTHVDAPYHFLGEGNPTVDQVPLELMVGPAYVVEFPTDLEMVTSQALVSASIPGGVERLIFKTRNSTYWQRLDGKFQTNYAALTADAAVDLIAKGVRVLGVDYLSVAPFEDPAPVHRILLDAGILIIEGLDLSAVGSGSYDLYCLPIKLKGTDGAPARAILVGQ